MEDFRQFVTDWLERRGWSQARLAEATEVSQSLISKHLADDPRRRVVPSPANLERYAPVLDIPYEDLMRMCGYLPGKAGPSPAQDTIEADVKARTAELLAAVRGAPQVFWTEIIRNTFDMAIDSARDTAAMLKRAEGVPSEDRALLQPEDRAPAKGGIRGSARRQRPIKPRHQALALAT